MRPTTAGILALLLLTVLSACGSTERPDSTNTAGGDWRDVGGTADESGYSPLSQINIPDIHRLGLAWSLDLPGEQTLEATPLAIGGMLYFSGSRSTVYAVDAASGQLLWKYDPQSGKHDPARLRFVFGANRGVAYAVGKVFVGTLDGRLIALRRNRVL